ncbi:MAG: lipoyl synthase [Nitrospinae bacterium]|nr:lipoyl synthase [Nitrospinota bacterium]
MAHPSRGRSFRLPPAPTGGDGVADPHRRAVSVDLRRPAWLMKGGLLDPATAPVRETIRKGGLATVCSSARCPNRGECFAAGTATFMILGERCTRACGFCAVTTGAPEGVESDEPQRVAAAAKELGLTHVVVTSVTRDDLPDGGAGHFVATIKALRETLPSSTVEVLTPDFGGKWPAVDAVVDARPDVYNHNVETVPRLYRTVRPGAVYERSLGLLAHVKERATTMTVKSGIMVGLGETAEEVAATLADLKGHGVDWVTIGQYLRPTRENLPVVEYVRPERFEEYRQLGERLGIATVQSAPYVRSSYHAAARA